MHALTSKSLDTPKGFLLKFPSVFRHLLRFCKWLWQTSCAEMHPFLLPWLQHQVKVKSLTECVQKAEETRRELEVAQHTLAQDFIRLYTHGNFEQVAGYKRVNTVAVDALMGVIVWWSLNTGATLKWIIFK